VQTQMPPIVGNTEQLQIQLL